MKQKRKDKNLAEKEAMEELKEIKNCIAQGKAVLDKAVANQDIEDALAIFNRALNKTTSNQQITHSNQLYHLRGQCYFRLGQLDLAEKDFQEAIVISDDRSKAILYISLGKCKAQMAVYDPAQLQEAVKCFEKALEFSNHTDGEGFFNLGLAYRKMKNSSVPKAIKQFTEALKYLKLNDQYQALIQRGVCYREIQDLQNSIQDFALACQMRKQDPMPNFNLGLSYLLNNKFEAALDKLSTAIQLNKNEPQYYNYKALALYLGGQLQQSLVIFSEALKLYEMRGSKDGEVGECWFNKGNVFLNLNRLSQALNCFCKTQEFNIDQKMRIKLLYAQGRSLQLKSDPEAIAKFLSCLELIHQDKSNDLYLSALFHLARNQQIHRQYSNAVDSLTQILQSQCKDKCVYEERGKAYLQNQNYEEALKDFQFVVGFDQNYSDVYYYRGKTRTNLGDIENAIKDFFRAIQLGSRKNEVFNGISEAYMRGGKFQKALIYSNISLQKEEKNQQFLIQRSRIYLELNEYEKGINDLSHALAVNEKNPLVYYRRGLAYYKNKSFLASIQDLEKSLKYSPSKNIQADVYYHMGIAYANLEKYQNALEPFTKALALDSKPKYFHERAKCEILLDQNLNAMKDLNQVIKLQPQNPFAYFRRGFAHKALKLYDEAAEDFMRARQLSPDDPRLIINKKQIYQTKYRKLCEAGEEQ